jgi:hypothetical protein
LIAQGHKEELINVVGFFVPVKIAKSSRENRLENIRKHKPHFAFISSGAAPLQHFKIFHDQVLPALAPYLAANGPKLSVFTAMNWARAYEVILHARKLGMPTKINGNGDPDAVIDVVFDEDSSRALVKSINMTIAADVLICMLGERMPFAGLAPVLRLPPIGINAKANDFWAIQNNLVSPLAVNRNLIEWILNDSTKAADFYEQRLLRIENVNLIPMTGGINAAEIIYARSRK